jgi:streptogramin lyase
VLELERVRGLRVIADAAALDGARWAGDPVTVLRIAPDEAFAIGATSVAIDDPDAIVEDEAGFVAGAVDLDVVTAHIEWVLPSERPALAQGSIAGVPAKLWLTEDGATLVVHAAYAADLLARLR